MPFLTDSSCRHIRPLVRARSSRRREGLRFMWSNTASAQTTASRWCEATLTVSQVFEASDSSGCRRHPGSARRSSEWEVRVGAGAVVSGVFSAQMTRSAKAASSVRLAIMRGADRAALRRIELAFPVRARRGVVSSTCQLRFAVTDAAGIFRARVTCARTIFSTGLVTASSDGGSCGRRCVRSSSRSPARATGTAASATSSRSSRGDCRRPYGPDTRPV